MAKRKKKTKQPKNKIEGCVFIEYNLQVKSKNKKKKGKRKIY